MFKKKLLLVPCALGMLLGSTLFASDAAAPAPAAGKYKLLALFRPVWLGATTKVKTSAAATETSQNDSRLAWGAARVGFKAEPTSKTFVLVRHRFDQSATVSGTGQSTSLELYFAGYSFSDSFKLSIGRMGSQVGGAYGNDFMDDTTMWAGSQAFLSYIYFTGISADLVMGANTVKFRVGNGPAADATPGNGVPSNVHAPAYGLVYRGNYGMFQPVLAYYSFPVDKYSTTTSTTDATTGTTTTTTASYKSAKDSNLSVGLTTYFGAEGPRLGLSYMNAVTGARKLITDVQATGEVKTNTTQIQADYKTSCFRPMFSYEMTTKKTANLSAEDTKWNRMLLTLDYYPQDSAGFSWYGGLVTDDKEVGTGDTKATVKTTGVMFGAYWNPDLKIGG